MSGQGHNPLLLSKFYLDATDAVKEAMDAEKDATDAVKEAIDALYGLIDEKIKIIEG